MIRIALLGLLAPFVCASLSVHGGKISLINTVGSTSFIHSFSSESPINLSDETRIYPRNILKLSFNIEQDQKPIQPHQVMILFKTPSKDYLTPIKTRKSGSAKFELDFGKPPVQILALGSSKDPIIVSLIIGHSAEKGLAIPLGLFRLDGSFPAPATTAAADYKEWEVERYRPMDEIKWTFKSPQKRVNAFTALIGSALVLSPWVAYLGIISTLSFPNQLSSNMMVFLTSVVAFQGLIGYYWTSWKLLPALPYFGGLALVVFFTCQRALSDLRVQRLATEGASKKSL